MRLATVGKSTAAFVNPNPTCPPASCTGIGTNSFSWGVGTGGSPPSSLQFTPSDFTPVLNKPFKIGDLTYFNGSTVSGTETDSVGLDFSLSFGFDSSVLGLPNRLHANVALINTPNDVVDPRDAADIVGFSSGGFSGFFHLFEEETASVPIFAEILALANGQDTLFIGEHPLTNGLPDVSTDIATVGFGDVSGGGFLTDVNSGTSVPEPCTIWVFSTSLIGLLTLRRFGAQMRKGGKTYL